MFLIYGAQGNPCAPLYLCQRHCLSEIMALSTRKFLNQCNREMEAQYMMLEEMLKDEREAGRLEGEKIGEKRGEKQSLELANALVSQGRYKDLKRSLEDEAFREKLLEEFGLKSK